jgi:hypothetical protein
VQLGEGVFRVYRGWGPQALCLGPTAATLLSVPLLEQPRDARSAAAQGSVVRVPYAL